jgi:regulator of sigma E protease
MTIINILLGLIGLGIVVFFHELGHFLAARLVGINVEAFSIGWGNPILKKKVGNVEYRLGMFPIGGYCKMQGDSDHNNDAYKQLADGVKPEKGSYHAASPLARILVCFAGPFFNLLLAVFLLSILWGAGFEINTLGNRIILASELEPGQVNPADIAGLKTGDRIIEINGRQVSYFHEIHENIALNAEKSIQLTIDRDGFIFHTNVIPSLEKSTGAGRIGIITWTDPVIENVRTDSPAYLAGLRQGDIITSANNQIIRNNLDFSKVRSQNPQTLVLEYERNGNTGTAEFSSEEIEGELGFSWQIIRYRTPSLSIPAAIGKGIQESYRTLTRTITSLRLLFMGIDLTQAVSGPIRITYMMGDVAVQGFDQGLGAGFRSIISFIALISIALCVMNLLPLPILDGGNIILFFVEMIRRKPTPPKAIAIFQTCGMIIILGLMLLAIFGDIMFFARR